MNDPAFLRRHDGQVVTERTAEMVESADGDLLDVVVHEVSAVFIVPSQLHDENDE